jgi:carbonic anhydrase/acetyltransferase-like protein (isoleucine patch superfamily)
MIYEVDGVAPTLEGDNFVAPNAAVMGRVVLRRGATVWWGVTIRGDNDLIEVGEGANVQDGSVIHTDTGYPVRLARDVSIGHTVMLHGCTVGENTLIGIGAILLNGAVIGRDCLVGAGALVPEGKVIPDGSLVIGVPGRVMRPLTAEEIERNRRNAAHYVAHGARYRGGLKTVG